MDPAMRAWLASVACCGAPPLHEAGVHGARAVWTDVQQAVYHPLRIAPCHVVCMTAQTRRGPARIYIVRSRVAPPARSRSQSALGRHKFDPLDKGDDEETGGEGVLSAAIVYVRDWTLSDFVTHERLVCDLAMFTGAAVVFVDYERAPERRWPAAESQITAVIEWIAKEGASVGLDGTRMAIVGDGMGAYVAASVAILVARHPTLAPCLRAQALLCPQFAPLEPDDVTNGGGCTGWIDGGSLRWLWDLYGPNPAASPLALPLDRLRGVSTTLVVSAGHDPLRAQEQAYVDRLIEADTPVDHAVYPDAVRDFVLLDALDQRPAAVAALDRTAAFLAFNLGPAAAAHP